MALLFLSVAFAATAALRALGETNTSAAILLVGAVVNAVLDPFLIHGAGPIPAYGLAGAAIAMAIGNASAALVAVILIRSRLSRLGSEPASTGMVGSWSQHLRSIAAVGLPAMVGQALGPVSLAVLTTLVAEFGNTAVAGFAVVGRLEFMVQMMPLAIGTSLEPMVAQSWGADLRPRAALALRYARRAAALWGLLVWLVFGALRCTRSAARVVTRGRARARMVAGWFVIKALSG